MFENNCLIDEYLFVVVVLYCVQFFSEVKMFIITVIPFGVAIVNYLVSRIIRMHQFHKICFFH